MADRYFNNDMPDFVAETLAESGVTEGEGEVAAQGTQESLMRLLSMPYHSFSERLKRAALDLKETVTPSFPILLFDPGPGPRQT